MHTYPQIQTHTQVCRHTHEFRHTNTYAHIQTHTHTRPRKGLQSLECRITFHPPFLAPLTPSAYNSFTAVFTHWKWVPSSEAPFSRKLRRKKKLTKGFFLHGNRVRVKWPNVSKSEDTLRYKSQLPLGHPCLLWTSSIIMESPEPVASC